MNFNCSSNCVFRSLPLGSFPDRFHHLNSILIPCVPTTHITLKQKIAHWVVYFSSYRISSWEAGIVCSSQLQFCLIAQCVAHNRRLINTFLNGIKHCLFVSFFLLFSNQFILTWNKWSILYMADSTGFRINFPFRLTIKYCIFKLIFHVRPVTTLGPHQSRHTGWQECGNATSRISCPAWQQLHRFPEHKSTGERKA